MKSLAGRIALLVKTAKQTVRSVNEEEERSRNLIIYGVKETKEGEDVLNVDTLPAFIRSVKVNCEFPDLLEVCRIGEKVPEKTRPIKVQFESSSDVDIILRNAHKLKTNVDFKSVYLDRTGQKSREGNTVDLSKR